MYDDIVKNINNLHVAKKVDHLIGETKVYADEGFVLPPINNNEENSKDAQIQALAYLLIEICLPTIVHYSVPKRLEKGNIQTRKARHARYLLKKAGF